jgi:hypothetical protein
MTIGKPDASRASAGEALTVIAAILPRGVQARVFSARAKIPFKVALYRDSLMWRIEELGRAALEGYDRRNHTAAILLVRGTMESVAALWSLHALVTGYRGGDHDSLDDKLMRMVLGSKIRTEHPDPFNVLTTIQRLSKTLPNFGPLYDELSEYAHPNDAGTTSSFAKIDRRGTQAIFSRDGENPERRAWLLIECLATTLLLVMPLYNEIGSCFLSFVRYCEADIDALQSPDQ